MGRYLLKFSKEDNLKYISHLDLLRVFQRAFKRAKIRLRYSQGYNPHAKIGFGHPLSLGYESTGEYMEFETVDDESTETYLSALASCMPRGIRLFGCTKLAETEKTSLAAVIDYASYVVKFRGAEEIRTAFRDKLQDYIRQEEIICEKVNKKKKVVQTDIRPLILSFSTAKSDELEIVFSMTLKTGSNGNLNPEMLVKSFCEYCGAQYLRYQWDYRRTEMYFVPPKGRGMKPLTEFKG